MIKKFRKKPVIIEAMQWCGDNFQELEEFGSQRHIISKAKYYSEVTKWI
jgi:hypothetical protein